MNNKSPKQIINLACVILTLFGFIILLFYWNDLSFLKILLIFSFMILFVYFMLKNSYLMNNKTTKYHTIGQSFKKRSGTGGDTLNRIQNFFNHLGENNQPNFFQQNKNPWNRSLMYASQRISRPELVQNQYSQHFNKFSQKKNGEYGDRHQIHLFIPQNLSSIFEEIKQKVSTKKHLANLLVLIEGMKNGKSFNTSKNQLSDYHQQSQSLVLDKNKCLLLEKDYEILIKDGDYCAQVISQFLQEKLEGVLSQAQNNFRRVSEMVMKIFGVKVNFYNNKKNNGDFDSRDITIVQLRQFLIRWRKDSCISQRFKLTISFKDFAQNYYNQLSILTENVWQFLLFSGKDDEMSFRLYVQILNQQFRDQRIIITERISSLSEESKNIKHAFLVHHSGVDVSFSYNRIKRFFTSNPLVAIMGFFAQDFRITINRNNEISRLLKRFFKQKSRI